MNDGIRKEDFSLHYATINNAITSILQYGKGAYLSKVNIKSAFRIRPIHKEDWPLLGIKWRN